jgi:hypothetical protein
MGLPVSVLPAEYVQKTLQHALDYAVMHGMMPAPTAKARDRFFRSNPVWVQRTSAEESPAQAHAYFPLIRDEDVPPTVDLAGSLVVLVLGYPPVYGGVAAFPYPSYRFLPPWMVIERDGTSLTEGEIQRRIYGAGMAHRGRVGSAGVYIPCEGYGSAEAHLRWATGHSEAPPLLPVLLRKAPRSNVPRVRDASGPRSPMGTDFWRTGTYLIPRILRPSPPGVVIGSPGGWEDPTGAPGAPTHTLLLGRNPGLPVVLWGGVDRFNSDRGVLRVHASGARYILGNYRHPGWDPYLHSVVEGWEGVSIHTVPVTVPKGRA